MDYKAITIRITCDSLGNLINHLIAEDEETKRVEKQCSVLHKTIHEEYAMP